MTERRKFEIAPLIMWDALSSSGYQPNSADTNRMFASDAQAITLRGEVKPPTMELRNLANHLLSGVGGFLRREQELAYEWLLYMWGQKKLPINNNLRCEIGNIANRLQISEVQTIEFFRLLLTDLVNDALEQLDDEVPLKS